MKKQLFHQFLASRRVKIIIFKNLKTTKNFLLLDNIGQKSIEQLANSNTSVGTTFTHHIVQDEQLKPLKKHWLLWEKFHF